jgi:4'-phosphopantetheinyl transferase
MIRLHNEPLACPLIGSNTLVDREVHVWLVNLDVASSDFNAFECLLALDERRRASRFHFERDRRRFIVGRGLLRQILASYLDFAPGALRFAYGPHGKPALADNGASIQFNLSHSQDWAALAVTRGHSVGVDLEQVRSQFAQETIAEQFFSKNECATLRALPVELQPRAFFNCWTRKEAFVKANGVGLSFGLDDFDVSLTENERPALLTIRGDALEATRWSLFSCSPLPDYALAVALRVKDCNIALRTIHASI